VRPTVAFALTIVVAASTVVEGDISKSRIQKLLPADLDRMPYMCECEFYQGEINGETTVFATRRERTVALMRLDGSLVELHRSGADPNAQCRAGARLTERWSSESSRVTLSLRGTGSGAEACWFKGQLTVKRRARLRGDSDRRRLRVRKRDARDS
jgi:hypothetical protein